MAAIAPKFGTTGFGRSPRGARGEQDRRAGRVARVSAKAAGRAKIAKPTDDDEAELDVEAAAGDGEEVAEKPARGDGGTYLSMYFRDMAQLDVLRPEQEFTSAREIEALEIALWDVVLAHAPAVEHVLAAVELVIEQLPAEAKALRKAADKPDYGKLVPKAARKLRALDVDHLYIDAALGAIDRISLGIGARGTAPWAPREPGRRARPPALERARAEWLRKVAQANRAAAGARNDFVKANLRLVVSIARRFNHGRMALADLIQEGNLGLLKAVERYDYRKGFRFSTYASWWIRHAISRALADKGREVRLPVHMIDAQHRLTKARRQLTGKLGRQPTTEELAAATQMPLDKIEKMRSWLLESSVSLDKPVGDDEGRVLGEVLEDPERVDASPTGDLEWEALTTEVRDLLRELRPIEADILRQRFGLETEQELTLKEIGDKYNLSRERIRQLQEQALAKMRRALARRDLM